MRQTMLADGRLAEALLPPAPAPPGSAPLPPQPTWSLKAHALRQLRPALQVGSDTQLQICRPQFFTMQLRVSSPPPLVVELTAGTCSRGVWCVVCGVWCVVCGVWCVVCGVWCVVCGVWCVVCQQSYHKLAGGSAGCGVVDTAYRQAQAGASQGQRSSSCSRAAVPPTWVAQHSFLGIYLGTWCTRHQPLLRC
jgi:hypothetical protein